MIGVTTKRVLTTLSVSGFEEGLCMISEARTRTRKFVNNFGVVIRRKLAGLLILASMLGAAQVAGAQTPDDQQSQYLLGMTAYGAGDYEKALSLFRPLAEQGYFDAQWELGTMYAEGQGVPQDNIEAAKWFRECAEHGYAICEGSLADAYMTGDGVPKDDVAAVSWTRKAAEQGDDLAFASLAEDYINGFGVPQNYVQAYMWFSLAADQKASWGNNLLFVGAKMSPSQIADAKRLASECEQRHFKDC
jgi:TPR repeat protein